MLALAAALLAASLPVAATPERVVVPVSVDEVDRGTWLVLVVDGDVLTRVEDLESAQLHGFNGRREYYDGEEFVHLASIAPALGIELDPDALTLKLTVPPSYFASTNVSLANGPPAGITYSKDPSAFFNYAFSGGSFHAIEGFAEAGVSVGGNFLYSSVSRSSEGDVVRGLTNFTIDDRRHLRRWVVGDTYASVGGLGGALFLGGVSVSRDFSLNPYYDRYPTLAFTGALTTPSRVDVYVNGAIVRTEQLPPGQFDLSNLSVPTGSGVAEVVIRDAFGQERSISHPFYASSAVLARGVQEYTYNLGYRRNELGTSGTSYEKLSFLGQHRAGVTDAFTMGFRLEGDRDRVSGGPGFAFRLKAGEIDAELGLSSAHGSPGYAGSAAYRYNGRPVNFGIFVAGQSPRYANLSLDALQDRSQFAAGEFVGVQFGRRVGVTAQYTAFDMRDGPTRRLTSLLGSVSLKQNANLVVSASSSRAGSVTNHQVFVGVSFFFKAGITLSANYQRDAGLGTGSIDVQKPLPVGTGYGFRVAGAAGDAGRTTNGSFQYQGPYGRYEATYVEVDGQAASNVSVSGGFVAIGGTVVPTRAVGQSFALIRVPGVKGVAGMASNQEVGVTSGRGNLLVPNLLPYYGNIVSIADADLPLDYDIDGTEKLVAPPYRGGAVVTFPVKRVQSVSGSVVLSLNGDDLIPAFGSLEVKAGGDTLESPLGEGGEFYFENLPAGQLEATIAYKGIACSFTLDVPKSDQPIVRLPPARCVAGGAKESAT